jgi:hypothetical protein
MFNIENFKGQRAPRPSVGECTNTGEWPDNKMVDDCLKCVSKPGWYGEKQFYCNGKCMSEYNTSQHCSQNSLVAKIDGQCMAPCRQVGAPRTGGGCSDKFDCATGMICVSGKCKPAPSNVENYGDYDYALNMYSAKNFDKMYIGVL